MVNLPFFWLINLFKSRQTLATENLALRYQLQILKRQHPRPALRGIDRHILVWFSQKLTRWRDVICVVRPSTLLGWHRTGFRLYWRLKTRSNGRPCASRETRDLIRKISLENPLWGSPRIQGELSKLGIEVSKSTVEKYMAKRRRGPPSQPWKNFLAVHSKEIVALDTFVVPTIAFRLLYVIVVMSHDRRRILHFGVIDRPNSAWVRQQVKAAFWDAPTPRFLLHDRDSCFTGLSELGSEEVLTAKASPWQNAYCERLIGTIGDVSRLVEI